MNVIQSFTPDIERLFTLATMTRRIARTTHLATDITTVDITTVVITTIDITTVLAVTNLLLRSRPKSTWQPVGLE